MIKLNCKIVKSDVPTVIWKSEVFGYTYSSKKNVVKDSYPIDLFLSKEYNTVKNNIPISVLKKFCECDGLCTFLLDGEDLIIEKYNVVVPIEESDIVEVSDRTLRMIENRDYIFNLLLRAQEKLVLRDIDLWNEIEDLKQKL